MEFLRPILAKMEIICQQPAMSQWGGVQGGKPASSGVLEKMAERSRGVLGMENVFVVVYGEKRLPMELPMYSPNALFRGKWT